MAAPHDGPTTPAPGPRPRASVVVPAHDEQAVLTRCLDALLADAGPGEFEVLVAANGCTDRTVALAGGYGPDVGVLDLPEPGKTAALNAADAVLTVFPRLYVDADVVLGTAAARAVVQALAEPGVLVAAPRPEPVGTGVSRAVRWHYQVWAQLPVTRDAYVGSGVFGLSEAGHRRVAPFPALIAEDQYVRRSFRRAERRQVAEAFQLSPPRDVRSVLRRAARSRAGNTQLERVGVGLQAEESSRGVAGLLPLLRSPANWPRVAAFVLITTAIRVVGARKTRSGDLGSWDRDESSRTVVGAGRP